MTDWERWETVWIEAYIWQCGGIFRSMDDPCDCREPRIDRLSPNREGGYPLVHRETLWSGTFKSDAEPDELLAQEAELTMETQRRGITLDDEHYAQVQEMLAEK